MGEPGAGAATDADAAAPTPPQVVDAGGVEAPERLLGRCVSKLFSRKRYFGTVAAYCAEEHWYTVNYDDGCVVCLRSGTASFSCVGVLNSNAPAPLCSDAEELDLEELTALLVPEGGDATARAAAPAGADSGAASDSECVP